MAVKRKKKEAPVEYGGAQTVYYPQCVEVPGDTSFLSKLSTAFLTVVMLVSVAGIIFGGYSWYHSQDGDTPRMKFAREIGTLNVFDGYVKLRVGNRGFSGTGETPDEQTKNALTSALVHIADNSGISINGPTGVPCGFEGLAVPAPLEAAPLGAAFTFSTSDGQEYVAVKFSDNWRCFYSSFSVREAPQEFRGGPVHTNETFGIVDNRGGK